MIEWWTHFPGIPVNILLLQTSAHLSTRLFPRANAFGHSTTRSSLFCCKRVTKSRCFCCSSQSLVYATLAFICPDSHTVISPCCFGCCLLCSIFCCFCFLFPLHYSTSRFVVIIPCLHSFGFCCHLSTFCGLLFVHVICPHSVSCYLSIVCWLLFVHICPLSTVCLHSKAADCLNKRCARPRTHTCTHTQARTHAPTHTTTQTHTHTHTHTHARHKADHSKRVVSHDTTLCVAWSHKVSILVVTFSHPGSGSNK